MADIPNMKPELFEAIEGYFTSEPEVMVDILLYLTSLHKNKGRSLSLCRDAEYMLNQMGLCEKCGTKLELYTHKEYHDEVDGGSYETMTDVYCPVCDGPMNGDEDID